MTGSFPACFSYRNGILHIEEVPVPVLAADLGTPFYATSTQRLKENYASFAAPFKDLRARIHYANKANPNLAITRVLASCGAGADITSVGEMERALQAGMPPDKIVFSGVGKTRDEIMAALLAGIYQINAESIPELRMISAVAAGLERKASVVLRVNPDVNARTHEKVATGHKGAKFGIDLDQLDAALHIATNDPHLVFKGLMVHVGSHISDYEPFREAYQKLADLVRALRAKGLKIERLDLGGGVGIAYDGKTLAPFADYAAVVHETVGSLDCELIFEPGRRLVGDASVLITRVTYVKETAHTHFAIVDAGMNDLIRPAMYGARHGIAPVAEKADAPRALFTIVGPVCESSDVFGAAYDLPPLKEGDLIAILQAGAYGSAMASTYNGRPLIPDALVAGKAHALTRRRLSVAEQIALESYPAWMAGKQEG